MISFNQEIKVLRVVCTNLEVERPVQGPCCWAEPYQAAGVPARPPWWAVSADASVSSLPAPSGSCKFFLPGSGSTHPNEMNKKTMRSKRLKNNHWVEMIQKTTKSITIPCCLLTHTCLPQLCVRKPPSSPFACPSELQGLGSGIWLVLCRMRSWVYLLNNNIFHKHTCLCSRLTVCAPDGSAGPESRVHARPFLPL